VAKSAAMDVDGLTKDNMDYGSSQLQTGDMLLPEPFLMMLKNCCASRYFSAAQKLGSCLASDIVANGHTTLKELMTALNCDVSHKLVCMINIVKW